MKSISLSRSNSYVSGFAVIDYSSGVRWVLFLYLRSPKDLVRLRLPSTRPSVIVEPLLVIRSISVWHSGLWSSLMVTAFPPLAMTHLESPAFATNIFFNYLSMYMTLDVHPIESNIISSLVCWLGSFFSPPASPSILRNAAFLGGFALLRSPSSFWPSGSLSKSSTLRNDYLSHSFWSFSVIRSLLSFKTPW